MRIVNVKHIFTEGVACGLSKFRPQQVVMYISTYVCLAKVDGIKLLLHAVIVLKIID